MCIKVNDVMNEWMRKSDVMMMDTKLVFLCQTNIEFFFYKNNLEL